MAPILDKNSTRKQKNENNFYFILREKQNLVIKSLHCHDKKGKIQKNVKILNKILAHKYKEENIYHNHVHFSPRMQRKFSIQKTINIFYHIIKRKGERDPIIISSEAGEINTL